MLVSIYYSRTLACLTVLVAAAVIANPTQADVVCYPDLSGDNVLFQDIVESSMEVGPLYGNPTVSGDQISFPAAGFAVQSINGDISFMNGRLDMTIRAKPGQLIDSLTFEEFGSFFLQGPDATAISSAVAMLTADGTNLFGSMTLDTSMPGSDAWNETMTINFDPTDEVRLVYDSRLFAAAGLGSVAFIDKGGINISVGSFAAVPEPASCSLLGLLLVAGCYKCRRRTR